MAIYFSTYIKGETLRVKLVCLKVSDREESCVSREQPFYLRRRLFLRGAPPPPVLPGTGGGSSEETTSIGTKQNQKSFGATTQATDASCDDVVSDPDSWCSRQRWVASAVSQFATTFFIKFHHQTGENLKRRTNIDLQSRASLRNIQKT
jgi:hypothetical protein